MGPSRHAVRRRAAFSANDNDAGRIAPSDPPGEGRAAMGQGSWRAKTRIATSAMTIVDTAHAMGVSGGTA